MRPVQKAHRGILERMEPKALPDPQVRRVFKVQSVQQARTDPSASKAQTAHRGFKGIPVHKDHKVYREMSDPSARKDRQVHKG